MRCSGLFGIGWIRSWGRARAARPIFGFVSGSNGVRLRANRVRLGFEWGSFS
jgi:hypothetical protein